MKGNWQGRTEQKIYGTCNPEWPITSLHTSLSQRARSSYRDMSMATTENWILSNNFCVFGDSMLVIATIKFCETLATPSVTTYLLTHSMEQSPS
jgi:hypothetical protein